MFNKTVTEAQKSNIGESSSPLHLAGPVVAKEAEDGDPQLRPRGVRGSQRGRARSERGRAQSRLQKERGRQAAADDEVPDDKVRTRTTSALETA